MSKAPKSTLPELSNVQLNTFYRNDSHYAGSVSKDHLPSDDKLSGRFCIVNLQSSTQGGGTHWTLLYNVRPDVVIYFDPIGQLPPESVYQFMLRTRKRHEINSHDLQPLGTSSCGWWDVYVEQRLSTGHSLKEIVRHFSNNLGNNEQLLRIYFTPNLRNEFHVSSSAN